MIEPTEEKKRPRSIQISMSSDTQDYLKILAAMTATTAAGVVNNLIEPYVDFTIYVLQKKGLADEFGVLKVDHKVAEEIIKNSRRDPSFAEFIKEFKREKGLDFGFYNPRKL